MGEEGLGLLGLQKKRFNVKYFLERGVGEMKMLIQTCNPKMKDPNKGPQIGKHIFLNGWLLKGPQIWETEQKYLNFL